MKGTLMPEKEIVGNDPQRTPAKEEPKPEGTDTTLSAPAAAAGLSSDGPSGEQENTPKHQPGPESLVARGIREHEEQVAELREAGEQYPKVDVSVHYATPPPPDAVESEPKDVEFVNVHHLDPMRSIPGTSPYLDDVNRLNEEVQRAKVEGREPDLANPPSTQGTPLRDSRSVGLPIPEGAQVVTLPVAVAVSDNGSDDGAETE
jgi:hypothetical protein